MNTVVEHIVGRIKGWFVQARMGTSGCRNVGIGFMEEILDLIQRLDVERVEATNRAARLTVSESMHRNYGAQCNEALTQVLHALPKEFQTTGVEIAQCVEHYVRVQEGKRVNPNDSMFNRVVSWCRRNEPSGSSLGGTGVVRDISWSFMREIEIYLGDLHQRIQERDEKIRTLRADVQNAEEHARRLEARNESQAVSLTTFQEENNKLQLSFRRFQAAADSDAKKYSELVLRLDELRQAEAQHVQHALMQAEDIECLKRQLNQREQVIDSTIRQRDEFMRLPTADAAIWTHPIYIGVDHAIKPNVAGAVKWVAHGPVDAPKVEGVQHFQGLAQFYADNKPKRTFEGLSVENEHLRQEVELLNEHVRSVLKAHEILTARFRKELK